MNAPVANAQPRVGDWMQTYTGKAFYPLDPRPEDIDIVDIAHALSQLCRFGGHCNRFYSVAEHSVLVSHSVPPQYALEALLHDATEAYVVDVPRPLKAALSRVYANIEEGIWRVLAIKWDLPKIRSLAVKNADNAVLLAEKAELLDEPPLPWLWAEGMVAAPVKIRGLAPAAACELFLFRFTELLAARSK